VTPKSGAARGKLRVEKFTEGKRRIAKNKRGSVPRGGQGTAVPSPQNRILLTKRKEGERGKKGTSGECQNSSEKKKVAKKIAVPKETNGKRKNRGKRFSIRGTHLRGVKQKKKKPYPGRQHTI